MAGKRGAPTLYDPQYCEDLIDHMIKGLSFESFAATIWVHRDTLYEWVKVHPEFSDAKKIGMEQARLWWEKKGQEGLFSQSEYDKDAGTGSSKSMNAAVWIFNMKNRFPQDWKEKQEVEHSGEVIQWHETKTYDPEQKADEGT